MNEKLEDIRRRALLSADPDEVATIMDEVNPWDYPPMLLNELMMHLRAALYKNLASMFMGEELEFSAQYITKVDEITDKLAACLDVKGNIEPELPKEINDMLTWLAAVEGKMDIYEDKLSKRIINRYMDYAAGFITELYRAEGFEWAPGTDGTEKFILKRGETEVGNPAVSVYYQLIMRQDHQITAVFEKLSGKTI